MRPLEITLSRPQQSRILGWSRGRKWVQSDMETLETSLSRLHPSRILCWSRGRKRVPNAWRPFETLFSRPYQSWILGLSSGRKWFSSATQTHDRRFIDFKKVAFSVDQEAENVFKVNSKTWIIAFSTSSKSHFGVVKRQKMSSHYLATTRKVAFSYLPSLILGSSRCRKLFERAIWALETSSFRPHQIRILRCSSSENQFKLTWEPLKRRFLEITQVAFWAGQ